MKSVSKLFSRCLVLACALTLLSSGAALAQSNILNGSDSQAILQIAKGYGQADLSTTDDGRPRINGSMSGTNYSVNFVNCTNGADCSLLAFFAWWQGNQSLDAVTINEWNAEMFFGKMYIDEDDDLVAEMYVSIENGVVADTLDDDFDWWRIVLDKVKEAI